MPPPAIGQATAISGSGAKETVGSVQRRREICQGPGLQAVKISGGSSGRLAIGNRMETAIV